MNLFTSFAGASLIAEGAGIAGVVTDDKGVDKNGKPKDNFTPGYELRAKVTVLAEGPRGSLTKDLVSQFKLDGVNPQAYGIGIRNCGKCVRADCDWICWPYFGLASRFFDVWRRMVLSIAE